MRTNITNTPAEKAGTYITNIIKQAESRDILLLTSGGSALEILDYIKAETITPNFTIGLVDDRYTKSPGGNNFASLSEKALFKAIIERGGEALDSSVKEDENFTEFYERVLEDLERYLETHMNALVVGVFGIGEDGHTASIFPDTENIFKNQYRNEQIIVPVFNEVLEYPERITVTPKCIEEHINEVVLYAIGENKCNTVITDMYNKNLNEHQIPALIPAAHPHSILFTDCTNIQP